jgi:hypothetical protein
MVRSYTLSDRFPTGLCATVRTVVRSDRSSSQSRRGRRRGIFQQVPRLTERLSPFSSGLLVQAPREALERARRSVQRVLVSIRNRAWLTQLCPGCTSYMTGIGRRRNAGRYGISASNACRSALDHSGAQCGAGWIEADAGATGDPEIFVLAGCASLISAGDGHCVERPDRRP